MRKTAAISFFISLLIFSGIFAASNLVLPKVEKVQEIAIEDEDLGEGNIIEHVVEGELLFLVAGVDTDDAEIWSRTDTLILVHVDLASGDMQLISIPRDTRVFIDDEHGHDKINHAHAFGGMALTMRTIRNFLGIDLDYYVLFNYESVTRIVDAIGGVEIDVPMDVFSGSHAILVEKGYQRLDGEKALHLARFRAGYIDGDIGRVEMQQQLVIQTIKELLKPRNIVRLPQLLDIYYEEVQTNLSLSTLAELIPITSRFSAEGIEKVHIPGEISMINSIYYYEYDREETQKIVDKYLMDYKISDVPEAEYVEFDEYEEDTDTDEEEYDTWPSYNTPDWESDYGEPVYEEPTYEESNDEDSLHEVYEDETQTLQDEVTTEFIE